MALTVGMSLTVLGCGDSDKSADTRESPAAEQSSAAPGAESGGVAEADAQTGGDDEATVDAPALESCLFTLDDAIKVDSIDDEGLQRRLVAAGQDAYTVRPRTTTQSIKHKQFFYSVYLFASTQEAAAEHERRLAELEDENFPDGRHVGDDDLVTGSVLISGAGDDEDPFDLQVAECAQGAQRG